MKKKIFKTLFLAIFFTLSLHVNAVTFRQDDTYKPTNENDVGKIKVVWEGPSEDCVKYHFYHYSPSSFNDEPRSNYKKIGVASYGAHEATLQTVFRGQFSLGIVCETSKGTTYYYKVRAYSQIDETTKVYSSYSSVKSIKSK